ncbi:cuticle protein 8-like [Pectinophora gossypiella]|uniref:cuticle protein 8-like n=1 Tax=Pectinophora gossypiella TaxID=13191 RepID=UPI00214E5A0C|nr:cuticle protein 8-like [Pectinophora gossypiella]
MIIALALRQSQVVFLSVFVAICHAGVLVEDNHHAVSSQSIVRHDQPAHQLNTHFATPVLTHATPIIQHAAPIIQHATPIVHHATPIVHHAAPIVHHAAPIVHHAAPIVHHAAPVVQHVAPLVQHLQAAPVEVHAQPEEYAPAHYEYSYSVEDPHTGDHKSQRESRDGDVVKGEYSLLQPDGSIRKVEYTADQHSGFNAIVHTSSPHAAPVSHAAPISQGAPISHAAPVLHAAPIVNVLANHH